MSVTLSPPRRSTRLRLSVAHATLALVGVGLAFRVVRYLACWPLWGDEAYLAVSLLVRDYAGLARPLEYFQIAPVGFLWVELTMIRLFGAGEWSLRLVPFLSGLGALLLFWRFAAANLDKRAGLMAVAIFAASIFPVRHASEVKPYATDLFLSLVLTCLARAAWEKPSGWRAWLGLIVVAALGVWASYPLIFVAGGLIVVLAARVWQAGLTRKLVIAWLGFAGATVTSWAVMYLTIARPQSLAAPFYAEMQTWEGSFPPLHRPWALPWWLLKTHTGNLMAYPYGGNNFGSIATALFVFYGAYWLWRRDRSLLLLLICPLGPALVASALHRYPYGTSARISLFIAPAVCLLAGQGLAALILVSLPRWAARRALLVTAAGFGIIALLAGITAVALPYRSRIDRDTKGVVRALVARTGPGDRWIGFNGLRSLPSEKALMLMPWLQHAAQFEFYLRRDAPVPLDWMPEPRDDLTAQAGQTWLIVHHFGSDFWAGDLFHEHVARLADRLGLPAIDHLDTQPDPPEVVHTFVFGPPPKR